MSATHTFWRCLLGEELFDNREEINQENRLAIRLLAVIGMPLSLVNMFVQLALAADENLLDFGARQGWVFFYFVILFVIERWVLPKDFSHYTILIYIAEAPIMATAILLGSLWDPDHQAMTYFMFLMAMPVFVLDRPIRVTLVTVCWTALFLGMCYAVKPPEIFARDLFHAVEFLLASLAVANVVIRIRMISLERLAQTKHSLEHDELTGLRNRRSFKLHAPTYLDRDIGVLVVDLDELNIYNDFYGLEFGNRLLVKFAELLSEAFGKARCYRYGGDEILCMLEGESVQDCPALMEQCRAKLLTYQEGDCKISPTCTYSLITGMVRTESELRQMAQMADIYAHKASKRGRGQSIFGSYDATSFHDAIIESTTETHVSAFETNQLTGLPSISFFLIRANELLSNMVDLTRNPVVGYMNLTNMKRFNNEFGYAQGDELIRYAAGLLRRAFSNRLVCCITGSQFGVLCYEDEVRPAMEQIDSDLNDYKQGFHVLCKAGFAACGKGESIISLVDQARAAQKSIVDNDQLAYRFYDDQLDADIKMREYLVARIDDAIAQGHLEVYYQPIIRTSTGKICNEEALSRWNDPERGMLSPLVFIPPLEESRQVYKLSLHVVRQVLSDFEKKRDLGMPLVPVSVNLSRFDFEQCDMVRAISDLVDASGFSRDMIRIEVTESAFIKNQAFLKREVDRFRRSGFEVWMDDFGSEYSTLNILDDLDFDLVKIDMDFMRSSHESGKNLIIVSSIIEMCKQMGIATLVEGVENEEHRSILKSMECEKLQGYLFSKPLSLDEVVDKALNTGTLLYEPYDSKTE